MFHFHKWNKGQNYGVITGTYVFGGGTAKVLVQKREYNKCGKIEINKQKIC